MEYKINEIFSSIQGEGLLIGLPMNFIRFTKCNLKCRWCDTEYGSGTLVDDLEIVGRLDRSVKWVSLTGGEPMLEKGLLHLIGVLRHNGFKTFLETNGTLFDKYIFGASDYVSLDVKGPSSGNEGHNKDAFRYCMRHPEKSQIKIVIQNRGDIEFLKSIYTPRYGCWVIQPEYGSMKKIDYGRIIREFPSVRVIPQAHRFMKVK